MTDEGPLRAHANYQYLLRQEAQNPYGQRPADQKPDSGEAAGFIAFLALVWVLYKVVPIAWPYISPHAIPFVVTGGGLVIAGLLFLMHLKAPHAYASLEIAFGAISLGITAEYLTSEPIDYLKVVGSIYIVVRGLKNRKEARDRDQRLKEDQEAAARKAETATS